MLVRRLLGVLVKYCNALVTHDSDNLLHSTINTQPYKHVLIILLPFAGLYLAIFGELLLNECNYV